MSDQLSQVKGIVGGFYDILSKSHPALERGLVRCTVCKKEKRVDSEQCLRIGWPKCCEYTMQLLSPGKEE